MESRSSVVPGECEPLNAQHVYRKYVRYNQFLFSAESSLVKTHFIQSLGLHSYEWQQADCELGIGRNLMETVNGCNICCLCEEFLLLSNRKDETRIQDLQNLKMEPYPLYYDTGFRVIYKCSFDFVFLLFISHDGSQQRGGASVVHRPCSL